MFSTLLIQFAIAPTQNEMMKIGQATENEKALHQGSWLCLMTTSGARCASPSAAALGLGRRPALARRPSRSVPPRHHGVPRKTASWQSRVSLNQVRAAESSSVSLLDNQDAVNDCIDLILEEIQGTDFGAKVPDDKRAKIDGAIEILIELSSKQSSPVRISPSLILALVLLLFVLSC